MFAISRTRWHTRPLSRRAKRRSSAAPGSLRKKYTGIVHPPDMVCSPNHSTTSGDHRKPSILAIVIISRGLPGISRSSFVPWRRSHAGFPLSRPSGLRPATLCSDRVTAFPCDFKDFVAQSHTPNDHCVRFAVVVTFHAATLVTKRALPLTWAGLSPAGSRQLRLAHRLCLHAGLRCPVHAVVDELVADCGG